LATSDYEMTEVASEILNFVKENTQDLELLIQVTYLIKNSNWKKGNKSDYATVKTKCCQIGCCKYEITPFTLPHTNSGPFCRF
jgi:hypothetical protein